jgi:serralysin
MAAISSFVRPTLTAALVLASAACASGPEDMELAGSIVSFDEYVASLPVGEDGTYVVEGDILVRRREDLMDYYAAAHLDSALILDRTEANVDSKYTSAQALALTYCVSTGFGANHALVRDTVAAAMKEWMDATKVASTDAPTVKFTYVPAEDSACDSTNTRVFFDVSPSTDPRFVAAGFFPSSAPALLRGERSLLITPVAFPNFNQRTFKGVMRHEVGHILGFRHEHINKLGGECDETVASPNWRPLTPYDVPSVMHYREPTGTDCFNSGRTDYTLTTYDNAGARCLYTTQARSGADTAGDACRALTALSSTVGKSFHVDNDGRLYRLVQTTLNGNVTSTLTRYVPATVSAAQTWASVSTVTESSATATTSVLVGGTQRLYRRTPSSLFRWNGSAWAALPGNAGSSVVVAKTTGDLFRLNTNGTIDRFAAGSAVATPILTTAVAGRQLFAGSNDLFRLESNGSLLQWTPGGAAGTWSGVIGTGIKAVAKTETGTIFVLLTGATGTVMKRDAHGMWTTITTAASGGASAIWGGLEVPYMSMLNLAGTVADESKIIKRNSTGSTWYKYALNSTSIMKGGSLRFAVNTNGKPYGYATP